MTARRQSFQAVAVVIIVAALMALAAALQHMREQRYLLPTEAADSLYITSGTTLKHLAAGYPELAADLYWIRAIQYYGGIKLQLADASDVNRAQNPQTDYHLLYPMLDLATTLDPQFGIAYRFGAVFLAEAYPGGAGRPDLAVALLEKGLRQQPDKWEYMQDIGFVHYWWRQDYKAAADWFNRASHVPGAPWWLRSLSATTLAEGGDRESSRLMWESIRQSAEIDWLKHEAERRLIQLRALDEIDVLQKRVDSLKASTGQTPTDWLPLVRAGLLPGIPLDPIQTPYEVDQSGRVHLSTKSPLFPLPDEPKRLATPSS